MCGSINSAVIPRHRFGPSGIALKGDLLRKKENMDRRYFLKSAGLMGTASLLEPDLVFGRPQQTAIYFDLHPFISAHPEAVFIKRTGVTVKTDRETKKQEGIALARELFVTSDTSGIPRSNKIAFKPNMPGCDGTVKNMGISTDVSFTEGFIDGMKELGLRGDQFYLREGNYLGDGNVPEGSSIGVYGPMAERAGVHMLDFDTGRDMRAVRLKNLEEGGEVIWAEVADGVVYNRIGYVAPVNAPDAWNLNIAKFKAHGMGLTLCCKNWQGTNVHPHIHYCSGVSGQFRNSPAIADVNPDYRDNIRQFFEQHLEAGVPRWDRPGNIDSWNSGPGMEMWSQKTLDNLSASPIGLSVIEGIYGHNGNGFSGGPGPDGRAQDFMSNVLIFGRNPVKVDIIGHWLGGHEPGNFGLFHAALDRGQTDRINPHRIPVYDWNSGTPVLTPLEEFERTSLLTYYLQRDYGGQDEPLYHMVDEPYEYPTLTAVTDEKGAIPHSFVLGQNYPNPFNARTLIEYRLPTAGSVRIEVYNVHGQVVDVLADGWQAPGSHVVSWDAAHRASGTYFYRFLTESFQQTRKMILVR